MNKQDEKSYNDSEKSQHFAQLLHLIDKRYSNGESKSPPPPGHWAWYEAEKLHKKSIAYREKNISPILKIDFRYDPREVERIATRMAKFKNPDEFYQDMEKKRSMFDLKSLRKAVEREKKELVLLKPTTLPK